jgi:RimJ/RimL family protein N-acetyltransferase
MRPPSLWQPNLRGKRFALRPLVAEDFDALYRVANDPALWALHPEPDRWQRPVFEAFFAKALQDGALVVSEGDAIVGSSRYYEWDPAASEVAIGYTFLARRLWGGAANAEIKGLMLEHAFRYARRVWFHVGVHNWRSRRAMEKIGGTLDRIEPRMSGGQRRETAFYWIDAPAGIRPD